MEPDRDEPDAPRRGRPGHDQETVLLRAIELFNRQGYDATSMSDLARELGLTKSAIYHHVPSKGHLLARALDTALDELTGMISKASRPRPGETAYARLRRAVEQSVRILVEHLPAVTLLLRVRGNSPAEQDAVRRRRTIDDQLTILVRDAVNEGSLRADLPPDLVSRLLFGMVNSTVEWYDPTGDVDATELSAAITRIAFDGLARHEA